MVAYSVTIGKNTKNRGKRGFWDLYFGLFNSILIIQATIFSSDLANYDELSINRLCHS